MNDQNLKTLVAQGLQAMRAGGEVARKAQDSILDAASHPDLKSALQEGQKTAERWQSTIDGALSSMGATDVDGPDDNPVLDAHFEVAMRIREHAKDDAARDLGIVAAGQMALHYWIASFGTMAAYTDRIGESEVARDMSACAEEAGQADEAHTELASKIMQG